MPRGNNWRMEVPCVNCPFNKTGPGAHLAKSLRPGRLRAIKAGLLRGDAFMCHKTTDETGDGSNLMCAGALEWQNGRGQSSNLQRAMEAIDYFAGKRKERAT